MPMLARVRRKGESVSATRYFVVVVPVSRLLHFKTTPACLCLSVLLDHTHPTEH